MQYLQVLNHVSISNPHMFRVNSSNNTTSYTLKHMKKYCRTCLVFKWYITLFTYFFVDVWYFSGWLWVSLLASFSCSIVRFQYSCVWLMLGREQTFLFIQHHWSAFSIALGCPYLYVIWNLQGRALTEMLWKCIWGLDDGRNIWIDKYDYEIAGIYEIYYLPF